MFYPSFKCAVECLPLSVKSSHIRARKHKGSATGKVTSPVWDAELLLVADKKQTKKSYTIIRQYNLKLVKNSILHGIVYERLILIIFCSSRKQADEYGKATSEIFQPESCAYTTT